MTPRRILIIEDELVLATVIGDFLTTAGHTCITATSAAEAMTFLESEHFDVVLTDITLSTEADAEGLEIIARIRADNLPMHVLVMTAHEAVHYEREAARLGARFLRKPIALAQLLREMDAGES